MRIWGVERTLVGQFLVFYDYLLLSEISARLEQIFDLSFRAIATTILVAN